MFPGHSQKLFGNIWEHFGNVCSRFFVLFGNVREHGGNVLGISWERSGNWNYCMGMTENSFLDDKTCLLRLSGTHFLPKEWNLGTLGTKLDCQKRSEIGLSTTKQAGNEFEMLSWE